LELSASVGFIHKESVTMHGNTIVKFHYLFISDNRYDTFTRRPTRVSGRIWSANSLSIYFDKKRFQQNL